MQSIPHLNELTEKFEKKGLTIIGVTDEPAAKIRSYIDEKGIKYVIAIGGAKEYETTGIPHSWLVGPKGSIVWAGHPASLNEKTIEENLKEVTLLPVFDLPKDLKPIEKDLAAGKYAAAVKALEAHVKKPKSPETEAAAKGTIEKIKAYGEAQLKMAEDCGKGKDYAFGAEILVGIDKSFKGLEAGDKAKNLLQTWTKDKAIKLELDGAVILQKAEAFIQAKKYKNAGPLLQQIANGKKFEGTKAREKAQKRLTAIQKYL